MFTVDWQEIEATGRRAFYCEGCRDAGREHRVKRLTCGYTCEESPWGYGIQQWILLCTGCDNAAGPFVASEDVEHLPDIENRRRLARIQIAGGSIRSLTMSSLTMVTKTAKEPRPKRQLAPLTMQREIHEAKEERNFGGKVTSKIKLKSCVRHPVNRVPTPAEIDDMAESLKKEGMLGKPVVRLNGPEGIQIVSGETRILAAKKLGWHEADMETIRCDDARALELLAVYNAKRTDLNPIDKARMIQQLCLPKEEGGSGKTREEAGKIYKLESHSAASNLVRLLELPQAWQDLVAGGELPESFARELLKVAHAPRLLEVLEKSWERHHANKQCEFCTGRHQTGPCWASRDWMQSTAAALIDDFTRPMKDGTKFRYSHAELHGKLQNYYHFTGEYRMLFDADAALEAKLEIHEFTLNKKSVRLATNIALYDKLQIPLIKEFVERRDKKEAERSGRDRLGRNKPGKKREPTPAERKAAAAAKTKQLGERIAAWRHKLLRRACSQAIEDEQDSGLRVVLGHAADRCVPHGGLTFTEALLEVRKVQPRHRGYSEEYWPVVGAIQDALGSNPKDDYGEVVVAKLSQTILAHESKDWRRPTLPHSFVESYAEDLDVSVKQEWLELQRDELTGEPDPLLEEFFLLHQTDQLRGLAKELGVFAPETANKPAIVKLLLGSLRGGSNRRLPLPKSVKPVGKKGGK